MPSHLWRSGASPSSHASSWSSASRASPKPFSSSNHGHTIGQASGHQTRPPRERRRGPLQIRILSNRSLPSITRSMTTECDCRISISGPRIPQWTHGMSTAFFGQRSSQRRVKQDMGSIRQVPISTRRHGPAAITKWSMVEAIKMPITWHRTSPGLCIVPWMLSNIESHGTE